MQRFKREFIKAGRINLGGDKSVCFHLASDRFMKFAYGASGTLTQAARWRREAFDSMDLLRCNTNAAWAASEVARIGNLLQAARWGGWRLP